MAGQRRFHVLITLASLGASALALMACSDAFAGPVLPDPTFTADVSANFTDGTTHVASHDGTGPHNAVGAAATTNYSNLASVSGNLASVSGQVGVVHLSAASDEPACTTCPVGSPNAGNAIASAGFTDSFSTAATGQFTFEAIANGISSMPDGSNVVSLTVLDMTTSNFLVNMSLDLGATHPKTSSYDPSLWQFTVILTEGDVYQLDYSLDVASTGFNSSAGVGEGVSDYLHTGGVLILQLDADGKPVAGDPNLTDASGWNYSRFGLPGSPESVPEPASFAVFGAALAGLGFLRRRKAA